MASNEDDARYSRRTRHEGVALVSGSLGLGLVAVGIVHSVGVVTIPVIVNRLFPMVIMALFVIAYVSILIHRARSDVDV